MADKNQPPAYVPISEAAARLSVSEVTIRRVIKSGQLPHVRFGRVVRVSIADLDEFAAAHRTCGDGRVR
ncbi:helix-turn-helix domain-containing protein [Amycolatopsis sp. NPDC004079]|uniref:helix-turn-helix domain-containing protein n=1 Tax=unclassified Amycolatopsis TaxID=2618356 RepID=UPI0033BD6EE9